MRTPVGLAVPALLAVLSLACGGMNVQNGALVDGAGHPYAGGDSASNPGTEGPSMMGATGASATDAAEASTPSAVAVSVSDAGAGPLPAGGGSIEAGTGASGPPDSSATAEGGTMSDASCVSRPNGIVSWWRGDGDFTDSIGTNSGLSAGGVTFTPSQVGQGFALSGQPNSYVYVPDSPSLELTGPMTIDAWINPTVLGGRIVDKISAGFANGYMLDTYLGQLRLIVGPDILKSPTSLPTGTFMHVAGVYDLQSLAVYINGAVAATMAGSVGSVPTNQLLLHIGADSTGASRFTGVIDEVRIFRRALSAGEIQTIFQQGASARCP